MPRTLVETSTGVFGCSLGDSQPDNGVGPLLRGPQTVLHGAVEVWHGVGHRWDTRTRESTNVLGGFCRSIMYNLSKSLLAVNSQPVDVTWSVDPARVHDGEVDVGVCLGQLLRHHHLLPLEHVHK